MNYKDLEVDEFYVYKDVILMYIGEDPNLDSRIMFKVILCSKDNVIYKLSLYNEKTSILKMLKDGLMINVVYKLESK